MAERDYNTARDIVLELTVEEAHAGYDFTQQENIEGRGYALPRAFLITGGGTLSFVDGSGRPRSLHVDANRVYPATISRTVGCLGTGYVQFFDAIGARPSPPGAAVPALPGATSTSATEGERASARASGRGELSQGRQGFRKRTPQVILTSLVRIRRGFTAWSVAAHSRPHERSTDQAHAARRTGRRRQGRGRSSQHPVIPRR